MRNSDVSGIRRKYARLKQIHQSLQTSSFRIGFASTGSITRIQLHLPHERRGYRVEATTVFAKSQLRILRSGTPGILSLLIAAFYSKRAR